MGHIMRADNTDPLRQVTFQDNSVNRHQVGKKRVGRPKQNWIYATKENIWYNVLKKAETYSEASVQDEIIYNAAKNRTS